METPANKGAKKLYDALQRDNVKINIGSEDEFYKKLYKRENRETIYNFLQKKRYGNIGSTLEEFETKIGYYDVIPQDSRTSKPLTDVDRQYYASSLGNTLGASQNTIAQSKVLREHTTKDPVTAPNYQIATIGKQKEEDWNNAVDKGVRMIQSQVNLDHEGARFEQEIGKELEKAADRDLKNNGRFYSPSAMGVSEVVYDRDTQNLMVAMEFIADAKKFRNSVEAGDGFVAGFTDSATDLRNYDFGLSLYKQAKALSYVTGKIDEGTVLTKDEQLLVDAAAYSMLVESIFSADRKLLNKLGSGVADSLPFMLEFMINPLSGAAKSVAKSLSKYAIKKFGKTLAKKLAQKALNIGTRQAANLLAASGMTATTGFLRTGADAKMRHIGQIKPKVDEEGHIVYGGRENGKGILRSSAEAFAANTIENWSEMIGEQFSDILPAVGKMLGKTKLGGKVVNSNIGQSVGTKITDFLSSDQVKVIDKFMAKTGQNGTFGEFSEEVVGGIANALVVGDQELNTGERGVFNKDNLIQTFLTCAIIGGGTSVVQGGLYYSTTNKASRKLNAAEVRASEALGEEWSAVSLGLQTATKDQRGEYLKTMLDSSAYTDKQKKDIINWVGALAYYDASHATKIKKDNEPDEVKAYDIEKNKRHIYDNYLKAKAALPETIDPSTLAQYSSMDEWTKNNDDVELTSGQLRDMDSYFDAREDFSRYTDAVNEKIQKRVLRDVDNVVNKDMDGLVQAKDAFSGETLNIVGGVLAMNDEGTAIDPGKSSKVIYYVDQEGVRKMTTPDSFSSIVKVVPRSEFTEEMRRTVEQQTWQQEEDELDGTAIRNEDRIKSTSGVEGVVTQVMTDGYVVLTANNRSEFVKRDEVAEHIPYGQNGETEEVVPSEEVVQTGEAPLQTEEIVPTAEESIPAEVPLQAEEALPMTEPPAEGVVPSAENPLPSIEEGVPTVEGVSFPDLARRFFCL